MHKRLIAPIAAIHRPWAEAFALRHDAAARTKTMSDKKINVAIVGLGFGAEFIPIYQRHPHTNMYAICQRTREKLDQVGDQYGIQHRFTSFDELLKNPDIHAVHINSPIHQRSEEHTSEL